MISKVHIMFFFLCVIHVFCQTPTTCYNDAGEPGPCGKQYPKCQLTDWTIGPRYHLQDATCGVNDPAGPFYDAVHGMYHLFYQDHVSIGATRVSGHMASRDLAHWTHLPVSIWNDMPYDKASIWTGSTTVFNNTPYQFYTAHSGGMGAGIAVAIPGDPTDPFYKNWTKPSFNPVMWNTTRDPSTAWQTPDKEYRLVTYTSVIYGSMDSTHWYEIGQNDFGSGECPSFFPMPKATPGAGLSPKGFPKPTHISKWSQPHGNQEHMQIGIYKPGQPKILGNWTPIDMSERYFDRRGYATIDRPGMIYASKDFYDPVKDRRIMWSWAHGYPREITNETLPLSKYFSVLTLAREITWNPELQLLQFSPIEELKLLRGQQLCHLRNQAIAAKQYLSLGAWTPSVGNQSEVKLEFELPAKDATFGVVVMGGSDFSQQGSYISVHYTIPTNKTAPFTVNISVSVYGSVIKNFPDVVGKLWLLPSDKTISLHVFVDQTVSEIYWQGGRQVMSAVTPASKEAFMAVTSSVPMMLNSAQAWTVLSPWVSEEDQLKIPRLDGKDNSV